MVGVVAAQEYGATGVAGGAMTGARQLQRAVDRLGAGEREQHARVWNRLQLHQQLGEPLLGTVREAGERVVGGHLLHLSGDRVRDLTAPVADRAVPQRRGAIQVDVSVGVPQAAALAAHYLEEVAGSAGRCGKRMKHLRNSHLPTSICRWSPLSR